VVLGTVAGAAVEMTTVLDVVMEEGAVTTEVASVIEVTTVVMGERVLVGEETLSGRLGSTSKQMFRFFFLVY